MKGQLGLERKIFDEGINEWRTSRLGKYVLIKGENIIEFYNSLDEAFNEGSNRFGMDDFFIEQILPSNAVNISFVGQVA